MKTKLHGFLMIFAAVSSLFVILPILATAVEPIFSDSFESNDFSEWTGTLVSWKDMVATSSANPHDGVYHGNFTLDGSGESEYAVCYKTLDSSYSEIWLKAYFCFADGIPLQDEDDELWLFRLRDEGEVAWVAFAGIHQVGGVATWTVMERKSWQKSFGGEVNPETYYLVEFYWLEHGTDGVLRLWVDGVLQCELTGVDTDDWGPVKRVKTGVRSDHGKGNRVEVHMDSVEIYAEKLVQASAIYIRADGTIEPSDTPISTIDNVTYVFMSGISFDPETGFSPQIVVERDDTVIDGAGHVLEGMGGGTGISLIGRKNVTIKNMNIGGFNIGIRLDASSRNTIHGNSVPDCSLQGILLINSSNNSVCENEIRAAYDYARGITLVQSSNNTLFGNNVVAGANEGICLINSSNNNVIGNNLVENYVCGIYLEYSSDNTIYHNNFINNGRFSLGQAYTLNSTNLWNNDYSLESNFEIRSIQWYDSRFGFPWSSPEGHASLDELKTAIPACNYIHLDGRIRCTDGSNEASVSNETTLQELEAAIQKARELRYKILLRILLTRDVKSLSFMPPDPDVWFQNYGDALEDWSVFAQNHDIEIMGIGSEMDSLELYDELWLGVIDRVRAVYNGRIFYNTNHWSNHTFFVRKLQMTWLQNLDLIGVSNYPVLVLKSDYPEYPNTTSVESLINGYHSFQSNTDMYGEDLVEQHYRVVSEIHGKGLLLFTGLSSFHGAASEPWVCGAPSSGSTPYADLEGQNNWYEAFFQTFSEKSWVAGVSFDGAWHTVTDKDPNNTEFSIQNKPAATTCSEWFERLKSNNGGYPSGGNYWSDYKGVDFNNDGIGDSPYVIDANNRDNYPFMGSIYVFDVGTWNEVECYVNVVSNSTVSEFQIDETERIISFNVTGETGLGFCRVTIPNVIVQDLWQGNYTVLVDGEEPSMITNWTYGTFTNIYFIHQHSEHEVRIIPEFLSLLILSLFMMTTLLAVIVYRRKRVLA